MIIKTKNKAFLSAFKKGIVAANCGMGRKQNPYKDKRNVNSGPTWATVFRKFWFSGFDLGEPKGFKLLEKIKNKN